MSNSAIPKGRDTIAAWVCTWCGLPQVSKIPIGCLNCDGDPDFLSKSMMSPLGWRENGRWIPEGAIYAAHETEVTGP